MGIQQALFMKFTATGTVLASASSVWYWEESSPQFPLESFVVFRPTGAAEYHNNFGFTANAPSWFTGGTPGSYWIRGTTGHTDSFNIEAVGTRNTWQPMSNNPFFGIRTNTFNTSGNVIWTFDLSTTSNGSNIVATWTNNLFVAYPNNL